MKICELFNMYQGNAFELCNMRVVKNGTVNFVSRTAQNNGVVAQVEKEMAVAPFPAGFITVALGGSVLSSYVQTKPFYTAFHIMVLEPKKHMSLNEKLYYCMCISNNSYRYSYGRQANRTLGNIDIPDAVPDWAKYMSIRPVTTGIKKSDKNISASDWKEYKLSELFDVSVSVNPNLQSSNAGTTPYVAASSDNNGITAYVDLFPSQKKNVLTIARNGSVGSTFYQPFDFCSSPDDIRILLPKFKMNVYIGLFIKTIIEKEKFRYAYGRKLGTKRIQNLVIKLPADIYGKPDFKYMESYIKSLPYGDRI